MKANEARALRPRSHIALVEPEWCNLSTAQSWPDDAQTELDCRPWPAQLVSYYFFSAGGTVARSKEVRAFESRKKLDSGTY